MRVQNLSLKLFIFALTLFTLSSCGFQLRQAQNLSESLSEIKIEHQGIDPVFVSRLKKSLKERQVNLNDSASSILKLSSYEESRRAASINSLNASQVETQLSKTLNYSFVSKDGSVLIEPSRLYFQKEYTNDNTNIAGKAEEERIIKKEIDKQIIELLVRRLGNSSPRLKEDPK